VTIAHDPLTRNWSPQRAVLLVEDEPFVRDATCRILEIAGFHVLSAADAQQAIKLYDESGHHIDLLMTDVVLPGRSGRELGRDLRRTSPEIPILLTSGYVEPGSDSESPESHTYYLAKPYSRAELVDKMEKILSKGGRRRAAARAG
jgi:two-component system, cell cycle sensor histidine kinase and response regulator CckA